MAAKIDIEAGVIRQPRPEVVFVDQYFVREAGPAHYDIAPDGRFLMLKGAGSGAPPRQINLIRNWAEGLKELAPAS